MTNPPAKLGLSINAHFPARFPPPLLVALALIHTPAAFAQEQEAEQVATAEPPWAATVQLGAGYDTNANGSTREQAFLGFTLDPDFVATGSPFGELSLSVQHTAEVAAQRGFISKLQLAHRANPDTPFADQTLASLGTEAVVVRGNARWSAAASGYTSRLDNASYEQGGNFELALTYSGAGHLETAFTLHAGRVGYPQDDIEIQDVDRYLGGVALSRVELGDGSGSIGVTLLGGRDVARRSGSPFGNTRFGALGWASWTVRPRCSGYFEISVQRSEFRGVFFDQDRRDNQYAAVASLEFQSWPGERWSLTPQLRYVRNDSTVSIFAYDRLEAAFYLARQL